jgi:hypothetical protein
MLQHGLCGFAAVLLIASIAGGCSASTNVSESAPESNVAATSDANAQYDPTSLKEVKHVSSLPADVQTLANNSFMKQRFDYTPTKFLVGGVGGSSAVIAYEQGGYVPTYHAQAYVLRNSRWVSAKHWRLESEITTLPGLISATASAQ